MTEVLTVVHECKEFAAWKKAYDADAPNRKAAGLTDLMLVRLTTNPNVVALVFAVSDMAKAKAMVTSPALRETMQKAGIIGAPDIHFRRGDYAQLDTANYVSANFRVRDADTFRKGFAMDKAQRQAAGLGDAALLQNVDDANDLALVLSISDMAKAKAFLESPALAEHQVKNAGVLGPPLMRYWSR